MTDGFWARYRHRVGYWLIYGVAGAMVALLGWDVGTQLGRWVLGG